MLYIDNILAIFPPLNTSLGTLNYGIYFENTFGFQDEAFGFQGEGNWLVVGCTILEEKNLGIKRDS